MVNIFSRVDGSNIESKETISLTPAQVSQTKIKSSTNKRKGSKTMIEIKGPVNPSIENIRTENSKMDESDVMLEDRRLKT